jgi:FMN phosphatase YigB (HAD superfamily)
MYSLEKREERSMKNKYIFTDVDGVLLNWEYAFNEWMEFQGHNPVDGHKDHYNIAKQYSLPSKNVGHNLIRQFNASAAIGFLPPLRDAQQYVEKLTADGFRFVVLTSLSTDKYAKELRTRNLTKLFGDCFEEVICLATGADKDDALVKLANKYGTGYWIEDKPSNADAGTNAGFKSILIEHRHNLGYTGEAKIAPLWADVYNIITNNL